MNIRKATLEDMTPDILKQIQTMTTEAFQKQPIKKEFSWKNFVTFWELAFSFPWNAMWLATDDIDEELIRGFICGATYPDMTTGNIMAIETAWVVPSSENGNGVGTELFLTFMEWAIKERGATRIVLHRVLHKDEKADDAFDERVRKLGFKPLGLEYYLDVKEE